MLADPTPFGQGLPGRDLASHILSTGNPTVQTFGSVTAPGAMTGQPLSTVDPADQTFGNIASAIANQFVGC